MFRIYLSDAEGVDSRALAMSKLVPRDSVEIDRRASRFAEFPGLRFGSTRNVRFLKGQPIPQGLTADQVAQDDTEYDLNLVGRLVAETDRVWLDQGRPALAPPALLDVVLDRKGQEVSREPVGPPVAANVAAEKPLRYTSVRMSLSEAVRVAAYRRTLQVQHTDGLTQRWCYQMAADLHQAGEVVVIRAGDGGHLVLSRGGAAHFAILEGRVQGDDYLLLIHLSHQELKNAD